jgi:type II secretory pathway component PulF
MAYWYSAYTIDKRIVQGTIAAASERMAEDALYRAGYHRVLKLREVSPGLNPSRLLPSLFGVKNQDVIDFSYQLSALLEAGIPILTALQLLEEQAPGAALRKVITGLARELQEGSSLSQALAGYPRVFSNTYCQMIKASEASGNLEVALKRMAVYLETENAEKKRVGRALIYPAVVLVMAFGVFILLTTVVLPSLAKIFGSLGVQLPWTTSFLLIAGNFSNDHKFYIIVVLVALIIVVFSYGKLPAGKLTLDRLILKIPIINSISIQRNMGRFCQITSMLLKAGLPIPQILNIASKTVGNMIIRQALSEVGNKLVQGQSLSQSMAKTPVFPHLLVEMVIVGETTGTLDTTLATMADNYERRVEQMTHSLISMIEPALIVVVGIVVAFMAVSMITPLYSILKTLH